MSSGHDISRMKTNLARLVAFNTENPPGHERDAASFLTTHLGAEGWTVSLDEYKPGRVNVVARLDNGAGPVFAFSTHIDVVPAGEGWTGNPFQLRESGGNLYGRGACDAKGPLVAMVEAMHMLKAARSNWRGTVLGVFVADEEVASEGARHYVSTSPKIDYAVIGEPTSNGTVIAHKGSLRPLIRIHGVSAHSGTPGLGENAIYQAARFLTLVEAEHKSRVSHRSHPLVAFPQHRRARNRHRSRFSCDGAQARRIRADRRICCCKSDLSRCCARDARGELATASAVLG
jgi:acetylornithine deacetylase/succinyl-diaminopimelate desuccinylase-like protein